MTRKTKFICTYYKLHNHFDINSDYNFTTEDVYVPKISAILSEKYITHYLLSKTDVIINTYLVYVVFNNIDYNNTKEILESKKFYIFFREIKNIKNIINNDKKTYKNTSTDDIINKIYLKKMNPISGFNILKDRDSKKLKDIMKNSDVQKNVFYRIHQLEKLIRI